MRRLLPWLLTTVALSNCTCLSSYVDDAFNNVDRTTAPTVSERARTTHRSIPVVDLHADPLIWSRSLNTRNTRGHVDIPRLLEGNVALQVFGVVTRTPLFINFWRNPDILESLSLLARADDWPDVTLDSPLERARYQAGKLRDASAHSNGTFVIILNKRQLDEHLARFAQNRAHTAGILALEGGYPVEGNVENVQALSELGVRMIGLSHFVDSELGGSAHGWRKEGLTPLGRAVVGKMEQMGITVDLAHASPALVDDLLSVVTRPVVVSHTGVQGTCPGVRNISDAHVMGVAKTGGVVGIGFFKAAVCEVSVKAVVDAMEYVVKLVGVQHVGLGSDFDGMVKTPLDASQLVEITQELINRGFSDENIRAIMGGDATRVLRANLPD